KTVGIPRVEWTQRAHRALYEEQRGVETVERVDGTVVHESETANLIAGECVVGAGERFGQEEWRPRHAELTHLLIHVSQVRDLEHLRSLFEGIEAVRSEESGPRHSEFGVARRIQHVATVATEKRVGPAAEEEILPGLLIRRQRIVEPPDRIGRIRDLQREVGE